MGSPGDSHLREGFAGPSTSPQDQGATIPYYTLLMNAGLSEGDIREVGDELQRRVRLRVAKMAASDDADQRRLYQEGLAQFPDGSVREDPRLPREVRARGRRYRAQRNQEIVAEEILQMGFSRNELRLIDAGLKLGLAPDSPARKLIARTVGPLGPQDFEILDAGGDKPAVVRDLGSGRVHQV